MEEVNQVNGLVEFLFGLLATLMAIFVLPLLARLTASVSELSLYQLF